MGLHTSETGHRGDKVLWRENGTTDRQCLFEKLLSFFTDEDF